VSIKTKYPKDKVRRLQWKLYLSAKKSKTRRFHALYERVHDWNILQESWKRIRANKGACGIDGTTIKDIETQGVEVFLRGIQKYLKEGRYHPMPVRQVDIPKSDGTKRPLGIPIIRDRVVQMAAKIVLEPLFEADFGDNSFGYRPKRHAAQAMERIRLLANKGYNFVLDADIKNCFGSIDHDILLEALRKRVSDQRMIKLIRKWLKAGVMQESILKDTYIGTPQGGVISPLLSNIYLNQLDKHWLEECSNLGVLIRYSDDFLILSRTPGAIRASERKVNQILKGLKLNLNPDKTKIVGIARGKEGFNFLGWYVRKCPSARFPGKHFLNRWPSSKSMKKLYDNIRVRTKRTLSVRDVRELSIKLNPVLRGWTNYFKTGNSRRQFEKAFKYLRDKLVQFKNRRRLRKGNYWRARGRDMNWFNSLGIFNPAQPGLIRYPGQRSIACT